MKYLLILILLFPFLGLKSQIETNTNSIEFEVKETNTPDPVGIQLPAKKLPSLTIPLEQRDPKTNFSLGEEEEEKLNMNQSDGLMDNITNTAPKAFQKDKEPKPEYGRDQYFADVKTGAKFVNVKYRDHESVDGDLIRVYVNRDVVQSSISLGGSFSGFTLTLEEGVNKIEFEALNQGSSGPNTAELHVYDDNGMIISVNEWNLLTGNKATIMVIKE